MTIDTEGPSSEDLGLNSEKAEMAEKNKQLLSEVQKTRRRDYKERVENNPIPTENEEIMGSFIEAIEPQGRKAFSDMYDKGYTVHFTTFNGENHIMRGRFILDEATKKNIKKSGLGASFEEKKPGLTEISFKGDKTSIDEVREQWEQIVSLMPDKGEPATPANYNGAIAFREKHMPEDNRVRVEALKERIGRTKDKKRKEILKALLSEDISERKSSINEFSRDDNLSNDNKFLIKLLKKESPSIFKE